MDIAIIIACILNFPPGTETIRSPICVYLDTDWDHDVDLKDWQRISNCWGDNFENCMKSDYYVIKVCPPCYCPTLTCEGDDGIKIKIPDGAHGSVDINAHLWIGNDGV